MSTGARQLRTIDEDIQDVRAAIGAPARDQLMIVVNALNNQGLIPEARHRADLSPIQGLGDSTEVDVLAVELVVCAHKLLLKLRRLEQ